MHRLIATIRRTITAAIHANRPLRYTTLSGHHAADVEAGRMVRTGDFLDTVGGSDLLDGEKSWFGRHVKKAYRARTGRDPLTVWAQHRTTGRWIHVAVYAPTDPALYAGLATYKATRHLTAAPLTLAA